MKIRKITLKDSEIREVDGEFERVFYNEKTYPAFLTNFSLKKGREQGLIEGSLIKDLFSMGVSGENEEETAKRVADKFEEGKMLSVIYLAFIGANKGTKLSFDEFLEKYHGTLYESMELYSGLIADLAESEKNNFSGGLQESTSKTNKSEKK